LRIIKMGFKSNLMPNYEHLSSSDLTAVMHYIKTLAPRWRKDSAGTPILIPSNPWSGKGAEAIAAGKRIYHGEAQCWTCHPGYLNVDEIQKIASPKPVSIRADIARSKLVKSDYGMLRSPSFKEDELVAVHSRDDLYRIIATGIPGTPMPSWTDSFSPKEIWALASYVESLQKRD